VTQRLQQSSLRDIPATVAKPRYDRGSVSTGIVHLGPGAFHRAHQAWFVEKLLSRDPRWGVCGVSLRSREVRDALVEQDCLYTLVIQDQPIAHEVLGAIGELLVAPEDPQAVFRRLCAPTTHIVSITVTEKGYCLAADGSLDLSHADIQRDLRSPRSPASVVGFLTEALRRRREERLEPFAAISCDNLEDNGRKLANATVRFAREIDTGLASWIEDEVFFPGTMVDSITPATTPELARSVEQVLGVQDRWPVQREAFVQWVLERGFRGSTPDWESVGVTLTNNVGGYEQAKLRLVNAAHSTLAYAGLLAGYSTVAAAMGDAGLRATVATLMRDDILPTLKPPAGLDLNAYVRAILERFRNPNMHHALAQIAMDGSQKLPIRILMTVRDALAAGRPIDRLCLPLAAWMRFVRRAALRGEALNDPLAARLLDIGRACTDHGSKDVPRFLSLENTFPADLREQARFVQPLIRVYDQYDMRSSQDNAS
jgi:fructuronate reductase